MNSQHSTVNSPTLVGISYLEYNYTYRRNAYFN